MNPLRMAFLACIMIGALWATPTVRLFSPPPGRYGIEDLWRASVNNPDGRTYDTCRFEGFVFEASHGQVFRALTRPFQLPPGIRVYTYRDVIVERTESATGYEEFATRIGGLPVGEYTFILNLMPFGLGDTARFEVRPASPPRLVLPRDGDTVRTLYPQFVWTPSSPASPGVTYELKLAEILPGQTPEEAIAANQPWLSSGGITATSITYPTSARRIEDGKPYAWLVSARSGTRAMGNSEIRAFALAGEEQPPPFSYDVTVHSDNSADGVLKVDGREIMLVYEHFLWPDCILVCLDFPQSGAPNREVSESGKAWGVRSEDSARIAGSSVAYVLRLMRHDNLLIRAGDETYWGSLFFDIPADGQKSIEFIRKQIPLVPEWGIPELVRQSAPAINDYVVKKHQLSPSLLADSVGLGPTPQDSVSIAAHALRLYGGGARCSSAEEVLSVIADRRTGSKSRQSDTTHWRELTTGVLAGTVMNLVYPHALVPMVCVAAASDAIRRKLQ